MAARSRTRWGIIVRIDRRARGPALEEAQMSDTKRDRAARGDRAASADEKHDEKTGVSRWRDQEGEKDGRAARKEARARRKGARRRRR